MNNNSKGDYNSKLVTPEEVIKGIEATKGPLTEELKRIVIDKVNAENKKIEKTEAKKPIMTVEEVISKIEANTGTILTEEQRRIVRDKVNFENSRNVKKVSSNLEFVDVSEPNISSPQKPTIKVIVTPEEVIQEIEKHKGVVLSEEQKRIVRDKVNFENNRSSKPIKNNTNMTVEEVIAKIEANTGLTLTEEQRRIVRDKVKLDSNKVSEATTKNDKNITVEEVIAKVEANTGLTLSEEQKRIVRDKVNLDSKKESKPIVDFIEDIEIKDKTLLSDEDINSLAKALDKHNTSVVSSQVKDMNQLKITPEEVIEEIEKSNGVELTEELKRIVRDKVNSEMNKSSFNDSNKEIEKIKMAIYNKIGELQYDSDDESDDDSEEMSELYRACDILTKVGMEFSLPQKALLQEMGIDIEKALGTETHDIKNIRYYYGENPIYDQFGNKINISMPLED